MNQKKSYRQSIKSISIFGGSQIISILSGLARTKIVVLLLGPTGVGLISIYQSIIEMIRSISGLGIEMSGVKDIATAAGLKDTQELTKETAVLKWWIKVSAVFGVILCISLSYSYSIWSFPKDSPRYILPIALLSLAIYFNTLATEKTVLLQSLRKIPEMVKSNIWVNLLSFFFSVLLYWKFGLRGIIPSFIITHLTLYLISSYYARSINVPRIRITNAEAYHRGLGILKLGLFIVLAGVCRTVSMFVVRSFLSHEAGLEEVGLFQSAWTISSIYLMMILQSMSSDFFPRLCAISDNNTRIRKLVNEQTFIVILVASPIIIGMLFASSYILPILYSSKFSVASSLLQWQLFGTFFKILSWPLGFILLAKGKGKLFLCAESFFYAVYLLSAYLLFHKFGLDGIGIAYLIAYVSYLILLAIISKKLCRFKWRLNVCSCSILNLILISGCMYVLIQKQSIILGICLFLISLTYSFVTLRRIIDFKSWIGGLKQKE